MRVRKKFLTSIQLVSCGFFKLKKIRSAERYNGAGSVLHIADILKADGMKNVFIAAGSSVIKFELLSNFLEKLNEYNIKYTIFSDGAAVPSEENIEKGLKIYLEKGCDCVFAAGGGKVIDCAKIIALRAANPSKNIAYIADYTAVLKRAVPLYAAPTTAGSGSEITMFAVVTDSKGRKLPIISSEFIPVASALDPELMVTVPCDVTAYTGMDALTHAIESYISTFSERFYKDTQKAPNACRMIFENLYKAYSEPHDLAARLNLSKASYYAGISSRRACVGYVHAAAHRFEEFYGIPHGRANAVLLPYFLKEYMPEIAADLSELAFHCGFVENKDDEENNAFIFIDKIKELSRQTCIPEYINELDEKDFKPIIKRTQAEAKMLGCPKILSDTVLKNILMSIYLKKSAE